MLVYKVVYMLLSKESCKERGVETEVWVGWQVGGSANTFFQNINGCIL